MLYHVPDIPQAVRELSRVVVSDGLVITSTDGEPEQTELDDLWQRAAGDVLGTGRGPDRISLSARFTLEKPPAFLGGRAAAGRVETIELPGTITVHDPDPVIAHMTSYQAWADQHDVPFEATIERARRILVDHIAQFGAFEVTCLGGGLPHLPALGRPPYPQGPSPAGAGSSGSPGQPGGPGCSHPRGCGEQVIDPACGAGVMGPSPRVRGDESRVPPNTSG
ncbi:hypothetical protein SHIRM173S_12119 [Streptomyces hirsutus]